MDKLNTKDIKRVQDTLKTFIKKTAGCEDNEELHQQALNIFGKEFADKPALIKQAASAYNSNKSIFKLSNVEEASQDFGILDGNRLWDSLCKTTHARTIEKAASADFVVKIYADKPETIEKVANSSKYEQSAEVQETMSDLALMNYMGDVLKDRERVLIKIATRKDICAREAYNAYEAFCSSMNMLTKEARAQVAKNLLSVYPVDGKSLMDKYIADNKLSKIANYTATVGSRIAPKGDIYNRAQDYFVADFAKNQALQLFEKTASDTIEHYKCLPGKYKMYKHAASIKDIALGALVADPFQEAIFEKSPDADTVSQKTVSAALLNQLREIETQNVLVDMYGEPFIASYPADEIEAATTQALQMLPAAQRMHPRKHIALIKTWVADILGRGGNMSAADTDKILNAAEKLQEKVLNNPTNLTRDLY